MDHSEHLEKNNQCRQLSVLTFLASLQQFPCRQARSRMKYGSPPAVSAEHKQTLLREERSLAHNYSAIMDPTHSKTDFRKKNNSVK